MKGKGLDNKLYFNRKITLSHHIRKWWKEGNKDLEYLSNEQLLKYCENMRYNIKMSSEPNNPFPTLPIYSEREFFIRAYMHALREIKNRNIDPRIDKKKFVLPNNYQSALSVFESCRYGPNEVDSVGKRTKLTRFFVKYGEAQFMIDLYDNGTLWIRPAWYYKNEKLNDTQIDQEMEKIYSFHPSHIKIEHPNIGPVELIDNVQLRTVMATDYWLYCLSMVFDIRLFAEYCKEKNDMACVIIKKPKQFIRRVIDAVNKEIPNFVGGYGGIEYIDIINPSSIIDRKPSDVCFTKDMRFYFEKEFRFVWVPAGPALKIDIDHLEINIGSCHDCCDLIIPSKLGL
jgi:hypothetical protein